MIISLHFLALHCHTLYWFNKQSFSVPVYSAAMDCCCCCCSRMPNAVSTVAVWIYKSFQVHWKPPTFYGWRPAWIFLRDRDRQRRHRVRQRQGQILADRQTQRREVVKAGAAMAVADLVLGWMEAFGNWLPTGEEVLWEVSVCLTICARRLGGWMGGWTVHHPTPPHSRRVIRQILVPGFLLSIETLTKKLHPALDFHWMIKSILIHRETLASDRFIGFTSKRGRRRRRRRRDIGRKKEEGKREVE